MKTFALIVLAAITTVSSSTKTFVFGRDEAIVFCSMNKVCNLALWPDDAIQDIAGADTQKRNPDGWIVARGMMVDRPVLYLTPNKPVGTSNLIVTTSARTYHITLQALPMTPTTDYAFLVPDPSGNIDVGQTPPPHISYVSTAPTPEPASTLLDVTATMKRQGDEGLAPARIERGADRLVLTFVQPYGRPMPNIALLETNGVLAPAQVSTAIQQLTDRTVVVATIFDLDHPIALYIGTGTGQRRLVLQP
jgi:hypothetical protein